MKFVYGIMIDGVIDGRVYPKYKTAIEKCKLVYETNSFIHSYIQKFYAKEQKNYTDFDAWFKDFVTNCNDVLEICTFEIIEGE